MGYYSFYKIIKDIFQTIFGRKFFRLLLIILIVLCFSFSLNKVFASNDGISTMSLITDNRVDEDLNHIITYQYNGSTTIYSDTIIITPEFRESIGENYAVFIADDGTPLLFQTGYSCLIVGVNCLPTYFIRTTDDFNSSKVATLKGFYYDFSTQEWIVNSSASIAKRIMPNSFLFSSGLSVYFSNGNYGTNVTPSKILSTYLSNGIVDCYSSKFDINSPYLVSFKDNVITIALKTFYPGYNWRDDTVSQGIYDIELSSYDDFYLYLYNAYDITNSVILNYTLLKDYIVNVDDIGKCIQIDLSSLDNFTFNNSDYFYEFCFAGTYKSSVYFNTDTNDKSIGVYDSYYSFFIEDTFSYGVDIGGGNTSGGNNNNNDISNSIDNLQNTITSTDYDESQIKIDSSLSDNINDDNYTNFITEIINSINNAITCDWNKVEKVEIPLGFVDKNITWTSDLLSAHIPQPLKLIINTFWMFLFGFYIFKFSLNLVNWLKSGEILDGKGFNSDEVITSNML